MIYFDNSATSLIKPKEVKVAMSDALSGKYANPSRGAYGPALTAMNKIYQVRKSIAKLFGVEAMDIAFTPNITSSLNLVIKSLFNEKDHVITSVLEHNSVLRPLYQLQDRGMEISFLDCDDKFNLKYQDLEGLLRKNTRALIITQASNVVGNISDLEKIYAFTKKHKLLLIIDGAQGAGAIKTDLSKFENTIYCFTGHKSLYGPTGTGGIINRSFEKFKPVFSGGSGYRSFERHTPDIYPDIFEYGTINVHSIIGLGAGVDYLLKNPPYGKLEELSSYLYNSLKDIEGIKIYGDFEKNHLPILSFNLLDYDSALVSQILWEKLELCSRPNSHCAPLLHKRAGTEERGMVRLSLSTFNTKEEIDILKKFLEEMIVSK